MTENSPPSQQISFNAWLIQECESLSVSKYCISITVDDEDIGVSPGDVLFIINNEGRLHSVAKAYRKRDQLNSIIWYLSRSFESKESIFISDIRLEIDRPVQRIDNSTANDLLSKLKTPSIDDLPNLDPKSPKDQAYIRELLHTATVNDLLGPANGPVEEIVGMSVRDRYLVGKLAPREDDAQPSFGGAAVGNDEEDIIENERAYGHNESSPSGRRNIPGEEFPSTSAAHDPDDDESQDSDSVQNQSLAPSSIGMTICVSGQADKLVIDTRWGRYERGDSEHYFNEHSDKPKRAWKRIPSGGQNEIELNEGVIPRIQPDPMIHDVYLKCIIRKPLPTGDRLVTIFLVNNQPKPPQNQDENWVFQPEIKVTAPNQIPIFRRRPLMGEEVNDEERIALEMIYRDHVEFVAGHSVSAHATPLVDDPSLATEVRTSVLPEYEVPVTETPGLEPEDREAMQLMVRNGFLDMRKLSVMEFSELNSALNILTDDYEAWIFEQSDRVGQDVSGYEHSASETIDRCKGILERLRNGISVLSESPIALEAFRFANQVMADQRVHSIYALQRRKGNESISLEELDAKVSNHSWRPFQLAFLLLSIPSLTDPTHKDRTSPLESFADLIWFPTGGGKTEAYLGVAAFTMGIRRLQRHEHLGGYDSGRGLAVIMRYTLRLLTLQQFQRASTMICAMEVIRRKDVEKWGETPFTIGLWVGNKVTPGTTEASAQAIREEKQNKHPSTTPLQLQTCPWCGEKIEANRDIEVSSMVASKEGKTIIYCGSRYGDCDFSRNHSADLGIPVQTVDDEIYRRPPTMMIATVDKFAMMAWRGEVRSLFGMASGECERHGLIQPNDNSNSVCNGNHQKAGALKSVVLKQVSPIRPPDLIIQDEFHLISGPLGTMVGLYETAIDDLSSWKLGDKTIRPKVVASTATVRKAEAQVRNVFMRKVAVFPPSGLDVKDNFFSKQRSTTDRPGRKYVGICAPGAARPAVLLRVYTALLTASQELFSQFGEIVDPYMTLVGYFNSLRELGGMRRLCEDDVKTRSYRVQMSDVARPGLAQRSVNNVVELTSRVSSKDIPIYLDRLETSATPEFNGESQRYQQKKGKNIPRAIDVVLATNMLSVGVDVNRLGLMAVNGQPKTTAEYIQATSRVGRSFPGIVFTVFTWSRPRDLSHYETFEHYHATFYKHVEAQSVTPFSPRAMDRGLTGAMTSILRLKNEKLTSNSSAGALLESPQETISEVNESVKDRCDHVTRSSTLRDLSSSMISERFDNWLQESRQAGRRLGYEARRNTGGDLAGLLRRPGLQAWELFTAPMSMREVEPGVRLVMRTDRMDSGPNWQHPPRETGGNNA